MCSRVVRASVVAIALGCAEVQAPPPAAAPPPAEPVADDGMPLEVRGLLRRRCAGCHVQGARDAAGWGSVLDLPRMIEARIVVPGDPRASSLIGQITVGEMPRRGPRLQAREVELLERWIRSLAPFALAR
jgi:mono/diheme cytochrome c family protein